MRLARRAILAQALRFFSLSLAGGLGLSLGCGREETRCYDPEMLSTSELALRRSRGYVDLSDQGSTQNCSGCQFFRAQEVEGCGRCEILGGIVSAHGRCDAWALRASA
jgi:hypothetical protein